MRTHTHRISATIPEHLLHFIHEYKEFQHLKSDSEVISQGLKVLEKMYLEQCYREAAEELEKNPKLKAETEAWEQTNKDGLDDETW